MDALAGTLEQLGYDALVRRPGPEAARVWGAPGNPERLVGIAVDPAQRWQARMLAAELVSAHDVFLLPPDAAPGLAPVYAAALVADFTGLMSDWGLVRDMQDPGTLGVRFLQAGRAAVPVLLPLLADDREVLFVHPPAFPSQVRTGIRIKDFAALYVGLILGAPPLPADDRAARDDAIRQLPARAVPP